MGSNSYKLLTNKKREKLRQTVDNFLIKCFIRLNVFNVFYITFWPKNVNAFEL